jgi:hypothetical protein
VEVHVVKTVRWCAFAVLLCLPLILYLGRPVDQSCLDDGRSICDPLHVSASWLVPVLLGDLALAVLLLVLSAVAPRRGEDEDR